MSAPRLRKSYVLELVGLLDERTIAQVDAGAMKQLDHFGSYVDAAVYEAILEAAYQTLGEQAYIDVIRRQTNRFRDSALMAGTIKALLKLLGNTPHPFLKHFPRLRDATVQGFGALHYMRVGEKEARFELRGYPRQFMNPANHALFRATFLGVFDVIGAQGDAELLRSDDAQGDADWRLTWR